MNTRLLFIITGLLILSSNAFSQETGTIDKQPRNVITLNPSRYFFWEHTIGYERIFKNENSVMISFGYKYGANTDTFYKNDITYTPRMNVISHGYDISIGYKFSMSQEKNLAIVIEAYAFYDLYKNKYYFYLTGSSSKSYKDFESCSRFRSGIRFLLTKKFHLIKNRKFKLDLEIYSGVGWRMGWYRCEIYSKASGDVVINPKDYIIYDPVEVITGHDLLFNTPFIPTVHLGMKLCFPF